jgi:RimJ/RimL family protein N-acetyltransferase
MTFYRYGSISLRMVERDDLRTITDLRNEPSTWAELTDPLPVTEGDELDWFRSISLRAGRFWAVAFNELHPFLGLVRMDERDPQNRSIRVGLDVLPDLRGLGHGTAIYRAILEYCFLELNCHRTWLQVLVTNERALRLYKKLGFQREGVLRKAVFRHGKYVDYVVLSLLEEEYQP